jgi:hypothetical protein
LESWIAAIHHEGQSVDTEGMFRAESSMKTIVGDTVPVVPAALLPCSVVGVPPLRAVLLPCALLDAVLFRSISRLLVSVIVLDLPLLLRALLLSVLVLAMLLCTL